MEITEKRRFTLIWGAFASYLILMLITSVVYVFMMDNIEGLSKSTEVILGLLPTYVIMFPAYWWIISKVPADDIKNTSKFSIIQIIGWTVMAMAAMYIGSFIATIVTSIIGQDPIESNVVYNVLEGTSPIVNIIPVIVAPIIEELIFRKLLIDRVIKYGETFAILMSAVMFSFIHLNLQQSIYFLCWVYSSNYIC